jgi:phosphoenolpyruvate carboxykinase (ATP)
VKGIAEETITWADDDEFGYHVADEVPGIDDIELLQPRRLYQREGRTGEYTDLIERFKAERVQFLQEFEDLDEEIIKAVG